MTYLGRENDFVKPSYSLTLFEACFRHSLGRYLHVMPFSDFCVAFFLAQFTCCLEWTFHCPTFTKIYPFLLTLYACRGNYVDIWPRISQIYLYQPQSVSFFILTWFLTSYKMIIKPINRTIGGTTICRFTPWYCIVNQKNNSKQQKG